MTWFCPIVGSIEGGGGGAAAWWEAEREGEGVAAEAVGGGRMACPILAIRDMRLCRDPTTRSSSSSSRGVEVEARRAGESSEGAARVEAEEGGGALWSGTNKNRDVSTGPLARPFSR